MARTQSAFGLPYKLPPGLAQKAKHMFLQRAARLTDQFGLVDQISPPRAVLPEFLFFGSTNVGKSSLLTALLNPESKAPGKKGTQPLKDLPRISKKAGFTETMSVYTVGNLLRLVDTPGYGFKSRSSQGDVATSYLDQRMDAIRQAYVLIHAKRGFGLQDEQVTTMLAQRGIPFDFVVTKCDLNDSTDRIIEHGKQLCAKLRVPYSDAVFSTSQVKRQGVDELRGHILLCSGLLEAASMM